MCMFWLNVLTTHAHTGCEETRVTCKLTHSINARDRSVFMRSNIKV